MTIIIYSNDTALLSRNYSELLGFFRKLRNLPKSPEVLRVSITLFTIIFQDNI